MKLIVKKTYHITTCLNDEIIDTTEFEDYDKAFNFYHLTISFYESDNQKLIVHFEEIDELTNATSQDAKDYKKENDFEDVFKATETIYIFHKGLKHYDSRKNYHKK